MLDCKNEHCQGLLVGAPALKECLCAECQSDFKSLQGLLSANGVEFEAGFFINTEHGEIQEVTEDVE